MVCLQYGLLLAKLKANLFEATRDQFNVSANIKPLLNRIYHFSGLQLILAGFQ